MHSTRIHSAQSKVSVSCRLKRSYYLALLLLMLSATRGRVEMITRADSGVCSRCALSRHLVLLLVCCGSATYQYFGCMYFSVLVFVWRHALDKMGVQIELCYLNCLALICTHLADAASLHVILTEVLLWLHLYKFHCTFLLCGFCAAIV